jgi:crotonobetainyl-CoA:carnitine CoA-transferase CaiB-like acyl-CoA transferase
VTGNAWWRGYKDVTELTRPLDGYRVIELAQWVFVPSATAILAELGADVIRVEHPVQGDPYRALTTSGYGNSGGLLHARSAQVNHGKRSIGVDLSTPEGRAVAHRLVENADAFVTSLRAAALGRLGLLPADLRAINSELVYARGDAFGPEGAGSGAPGYDITAFWARGGVGNMLTEPDADNVVRQPPSFGDRIASLGLGLGIIAALLQRERGGGVTEVSASLMGAAAWVSASDLVSLSPQEQPPAAKRPAAADTPLTGSYRCADGRFPMINFMQSDRYFAEFTATIGGAWLAADKRFEDHAARSGHGKELRAELQSLIGQRTLAEWRELLAGFDGPWAPVQDAREFRSDPQVVANGFLREVAGDDGLKLVRAPVTVGEVPDKLPRSPELGEHTETVLLELGWTWDEIEALKGAGAII